MEPADRALWHRIEPILDRALEVEGAARDALLAEACAGDPELLAQVRTLLRAAELSSPLDAPLQSLAGSLAAEAGESLALQGPVEGRAVGPWRIEEEIGAGGMGRVFLATRADGQFDQKVALKILRWEMATPALVERFRAERQILADLDHPGIARLIDGGVTEDGLPFLVMEYVDGDPIDQWCAERELDVDARLEMFCAAAEAVEHAHRNLVVHRDLKPSNILAIGPGAVKLLDFGVAKIVDEGAHADLTQAHPAPATPRSAAPEQLAGGSITTATDTWALGVLLYQLLTGSVPFGEPGMALTDLSRKVLEDDPVPPSERVAGAAGRRLRGDLDNIVLKALRKEPERRYASVERLVEDVRRYREGLPVLARPSTIRYRARKFVARHTVALGVAVGVFVMMVALVGFYTWRLAEERDLATLQARQTEEVKGFVLSLFEVNDPAQALGREIGARELLDRGAERIEDELRDQPEIRAEMLMVLGHLYEELGHYEQAVGLWEEALSLRRDRPGQRGEDLSDALARYGYALGELGRGEEAESALREALALRRQSDPGSEAVANSLNQLGMFLAYAGEYEEAESMLRECVSIREGGPEGESATLAAGLANLGLTVKWKGDFDEAELLYRRALDIRARTIGHDDPEYANNLDNLGVLLGQRGDFEESERCFEEALEIRTRLLGEEHPDVALSVNNLATLYRVQGRLDEAEPMYRRVLELNTKIFGPEHRRVATNLTNLASVHSARGDHATARSMYERSLEIRRAQLGDRHIDVAVNLNHLCVEMLALGELDRVDALSGEALGIAREAVGDQSLQLAQVLHLRGEVLLRIGRSAEAIPVLEEALVIREAVLAADHRGIAATRALLGASLFEQGRQAEGEPLLLASLENLDRDQPGDALYRELARSSLHELYLSRGDAERAATYGPDDE